MFNFVNIEKVFLSLNVSFVILGVDVIRIVNISGVIEDL